MIQQVGEGDCSAAERKENGACKAEVGRVAPLAAETVGAGRGDDVVEGKNGA